MRTLGRALVRIVFWSFERGTWPYDVAVALIVLFVLFSPRGWFNDRPRTAGVAATSSAPAAVEFLGADPVDGAPIYRVEARLISQDNPDFEGQLREAVAKHASQPPANVDFKILRVASVRQPDGAVTHYDVSIKP